MAQRWSREPGWYPDSVGDANFRWWDGAQWTEAVSDTLWAPDPDQPAPYLDPAARQHAAPVPGRSSPEHPPAGATAVVSGHEVPTVVEVEDEERSRRRPLLIGLASVVAVVGLAVGGFLILRPDSSSGEQSSASSSEQEDRTAPRSRPDTTAGPPSSPAPSAEASEGSGSSDGEDGEGEARVLPRYSEPDQGWVRGRGFVPHSQVHRYVTEENYNGDEDWGAFLAAGEVPQGVTAADELVDTARRVGRWYAGTGFASDDNPTVETVGGGPTRIGSRPAYEIQLRVEYEIDGLRADWDRTTVVVFGLGPGRRHGVFIASVPNTHPELREAVEEAKSSLRLSKGD